MGSYEGFDRGCGAVLGGPVAQETAAEGVEAAGIPVREARLTLQLILRASEMIVLGSGMGVQALSSIDGRVIGKARGRLFQAANTAWVERVENAWLSRDEVGV